ncbi:MAG: DUF1588 domain-containing protein [Myxococcota bacterium]|nr:DUF1588 domain-containing protein [Myxococcota bacterium]
MRCRRELATLVLSTACWLGVGCDGLLLDGAVRPGSHDRDPPPSDGAPDGGVVAACVSLEDHYRARLWPGVIQPRCASCHSATGPAQGSQLVLLDDHASDANLEVLTRLALTGAPTPRLLEKPTGGLEHGGGAVLSRDELAYDLLAQFAALAASPPDCDPVVPDDVALEVVELGPAALFRKVALSLAGRLPRPEELERLEREGETALVPLLDALMEEPGFYVRLREGYNDILLTDAALVDRDTHPAGYLDERAYPERQWFNAYAVEEGRAQLADGARVGLTRGPLELIVHVVREHRPFTEVLTADYVMVNSFAARSYGVYRESDYVDPADPSEFRPARLPPIPGGGDAYPHAGVLSSYFYLHRYPSTPTNRNRLRARMVLAHWLDFDVMDLSPSGADPTDAATFDDPVREASQCSVCHRLIDPIAGTFQNHDDIGRYLPREEGWYRDTFAPGFGEDALPSAEVPRALPWLAQRVVEDRRFVRAVTSHAFQILFGRRPLSAPDDPSATDFAARLVAYEREQEMLAAARAVFTADGHELRSLLRALVLSPSYRAAGLVRPPASLTEQRVAESLGAPRLLSPELLTRRLREVLGTPWIYRYGEPLLAPERFRLLYGGIDSRATIVRMAEPNALMASVAELMANDVACRTVAGELERATDARVLLPEVGLTDVPSDPAADVRIRAAIASLHERLLGERDAGELETTHALFTTLQSEGARGVASGELSIALERRCWQGVSALRQDPDYTVRAWSGVVSYLLQTYEFLHE